MRNQFPKANFAIGDYSPESWGSCHIRGDADTIPASCGWIRHHEQYNEFLAGPHAPLKCVSCHNPHKKSQFSIKEGATCGDCHSNIMASYAQTSMYDYDVACQDCHMPFASKSAQALGRIGRIDVDDLMAHLFELIQIRSVSFWKLYAVTEFSHHGFVKLRAVTNSLVTLEDGTGEGQACLGTTLPAVGLG